MYQFFASIHARPEQVDVGPQLPLEGAALPTLQVPPALLGHAFDRNFEDTLEALSRYERMFVEPDGSFVWVSSHSEPSWQVDGNLYDRDELLLFVDIKGNCPGDRFDQLLQALGWPDTVLMFQLTQHAVFLAEEQFRQYAARPNQPATAATPPPID